MTPSTQSTDLPVNEVPADVRSVSDESDTSNEEGWEDVEPEDDSQPVVGLFSDTIFPDIRSMLKECKEKNNFDLRKIQKDLGKSSDFSSPEDSSSTRVLPSRLCWDLGVCNL